MPRRSSAAADHPSPTLTPTPTRLPLPNLTLAPDASWTRERMAVLLSSSDLTKSYGPRTLFAGTSLDLRDGERIGFIAPNGAGKSTLLKIFAGLEHTDAGTVARSRTARIAYLPQDPVLDSEWTIEQAVADALRDDHAEEH